jgi:hypothetical protein
MSNFKKLRKITPSSPPFPAILSLVPKKNNMTEEEYKEIRSSIDSVGEYFKAIEELTDIRDAIDSIDASSNVSILESPVQLKISFQGRFWDDTDIIKYLDAETILYIRNAILRRFNGRISFFKREIEAINYTKRKTKKK